METINLNENEKYDCDRVDERWASGWAGERTDERTEYTYYGRTEYGQYTYV